MPFIDGAARSRGGMIVCYAAALASLVGIVIQIENIRARKRSQG